MESEAALVNALAKVGPVTVAIYAGQQSFRLYSGSFYNEPKGSNGYYLLNHAVAAVGYGWLWKQRSGGL